MGDTCCNNETMGRVVRLVQEEIPGVFVHSVKLGGTEGADRNAGFFGNLNSQIDGVCTELASMSELKHGVNLMGFSQGGLFLRALVQRCPQLNPHALVSFGSPHSGVARIPECPRDDMLCNWMRKLASRGVYSWYIRDHVVQAQYFKDPERLDDYLQHNIFLPDVNNELLPRKPEYRERLVQLKKMVLVRFASDDMIYPEFSSWFGFLDSQGNSVPVENTTMFKEDWLGLRELDESGRLEYVSIEGKHMEISDHTLRSIVSRHFASSSISPVFYQQS
ncbi:hypothetical protein EV183_001629 [Coemansia sp. RSA 2336]|nr:hypothetical protein EV183_001629 [Coemansia sp. RSA 2336]